VWPRRAHGGGLAAAMTGDRPFRVIARSRGAMTLKAVRPHVSYGIFREIPKPYNVTVREIGVAFMREIFANLNEAVDHLGSANRRRCAYCRRAYASAMSPGNPVVFGPAISFCIAPPLCCT
jgi:hypothetical protein